MSLAPREDPDAQTTVNDFQDYTEYLPSDLTRSLSLIGKLDHIYLERANKVHLLSKTYGEWPKLPECDKPDLDSLRRDISQHLQHAILSRESAYGEAARLSEMVNRHYKRLVSISGKLKALPKPPSRDPTPVPRSPQASRKTPTRITLRLDSTRHAAATGRNVGTTEKSGDRKRRITIPGEVLPPPNPDSPTSFTASDWESMPPSPLPMPTSRVGGSSRHKKKPVRLRPPKPPKVLKERPPRPPRQPGMGTNVHSQVAGISTSNALSLLPAPPADAKVGSEHAPWMRLTEYEMAKLRKRMKKNAIWTPSETMIRRELADAGRGPENYRHQRAEATEKGEEFVDVDNIAEAVPGKPLAPGEISADSLGAAESNLSNRGMKLNEAKKLKREAMLAASAEEMKAAANRVADIGSNFKELFSKPTGLLLSPATTRIVSKDKSWKKEKSDNRDKSKEEGSLSSKKRKREEELPNFETSKPSTETTMTTPTEKPSKKKLKSSQEQPSPSPTVITETTTTIVPLAAPAPSPKKEVAGRNESKEQPHSSTLTMPAPEKPPKINGPAPKQVSTPIPTASSHRPRRISLTLKGPTEPPSKVQPAPHTAPLSSGPRSASLRSSVGPPSASLRGGDHNRRHSTTSPTTPTTPASSKQVVTSTAASRRSKRPAPGAVLKDQDGGATVSVGKRAHAPKKGAGANGNAAAKPLVPTANDNSAAEGKENIDAATTSLMGGEYIDPNEPRYCLCGDVSYGEMVGCDNDDVRCTLC